MKLINSKQQETEKLGHVFKLTLGKYSKLSISQKGYVYASLGFIIKFQHEHIWVIFQLIQGLTRFIGKIMNKQSYKQRNQLALNRKGCGIYML